MDGIRYFLFSERSSAIAAAGGCRSRASVRALAFALLLGTLGFVAAPRAGTASIVPHDIDHIPSVGQAPTDHTLIPDAPPETNLDSGKSKVMRQDDRPPHLSILDATPRKNFEMRLRLKALPGPAEDIGGVVLRLTERGNYYVLKVDVTRNRVVFARVSNGRLTEIIGVDSNISRDAWHTFAIRAEDGRFAVSLDGQWLFTAYDETLRKPGRVAFWRKPGSAMRFDPVAIEPLPANEQP